MMLRLPKTFALMFPLSILCLSATFAWGAPDNTFILRLIRARYAIVNHRLGHCVPVKRNLNGRSAEGGELIGYRSGSSFCKLTALFYGETGQTREEYYFWHGKLFFVDICRTIYERPLGAEADHASAGAVKKATQERFYLDNGKLIRWLGADNLPQAFSGKTAQRQAQQLAESVHEYLAILVVR